MREDRLDRERYLFYVCCSRAERLLVLSSRSSDEEGNPQPQSFFVEDVRDLLAPGPPTRERSLSDVTWSPEDAPTAAELERALAVAGPRPEQQLPGALSSAPLLERLGAREAVSAGALERFADCPVKWLVEDLLRPDELVPDPEAMVRGQYAHSVLQRTFERLREETGARRVTPANLAAAERILLEELREQQRELPDLAQADPRAGRRAPARVRPAAASCAARPSATAASSPSTSSCRSATARPASRSRSTPACGCAGASTAWTRATAWRS